MREHTAPVRSVAVTADGSLAVSGSEDRTVRVWNLRDGRCTAVFGDHTDIVHCVAVTGDGRFAISGSEDGTVRVWDLNVKRCIRTLGGHASAVWSVAVTGDGLRAFGHGRWNRPSVEPRGCPIPSPFTKAVRGPYTA